jgi:peptide chain release factor 3
VVGIVNPGRLAIGDTLYAGQRVRYTPIPQFPAERFAYLRPADGHHKRFDEAVRQLEEEGLMQVFLPTSGGRLPIIGVVGPLQFDVVKARLQSEYGIQSAIENLPYVAARWPLYEPAATTGLTLATFGALTVRDRLDREVILFESDWALQYVQEKNPHVALKDSTALALDAASQPGLGEA